MAALYPWAILGLHAHCLFLYPGVVSALSSSQQEFHTTDTQMNDASFTDHILFPFTAARSQLDCGRLCSRHRDCKAFTYAPAGPPDACQGYSAKMASGDPRVDLPHARTFTIPSPTAVPDWISTACVSHQDCVSRIPASDQYQTGQLPICYKQLWCLCHIGYFYSVSLKLCVQDCPPSQLQSSYTMYPGSGINSVESILFIGDLDHCKRECSARSDCEIFETGGSKCHGARTGWVYFVTNKEPWNLYQRDCA